MKRQSSTSRTSWPDTTQRPATQNPIGAGAGERDTVGPHQIMPPRRGALACAPAHPAQRQPCHYASTAATRHSWCATTAIRSHSPQQKLRGTVQAAHRRRRLGPRQKRMVA
jgi:hypothetical protein